MLNIIPSDGASVFSVLTAAQTLALVRPTNPPPGLAGFLFDIDGDDVMRLRSQISKHYIEDNTTIQDQIALEPETIVVRRMVAEVVYQKPAAAPVSPTPNPLPINSAMQPLLTPGGMQLQAQLAPGVSVTQDVQSLWNFYLGTAPAGQTRQSIVAGYLYQLWLGREQFTVETPWGVMTSMAIESADFEQPEETATKSDFNITFQKIRIAQPATVTVGMVAGRATIQQMTPVQGGTAGLTQLTPGQQSSVLGQIMYPPTTN